MQHLYNFAKPFLGIACLVLFLSTGSFAQTTTTGGTGLFGDGSDGDVKIDKFTMLTRDMYYHDLTITTRQTLDTGGFRVFVSGTLTLGNGARISRNGDPEGTALSAGTLGGSGAGGTYINETQTATKAENVTNSLGGSGSSFWDPVGGGEAIQPKTSGGGGGVFRSALQALSGRSLDGVLVNGGAGGPGFVNGGSGGGVVVVAACTVVVSGGMATISANGGPSAGGGVVVLMTTTPRFAALKLSASGGTPDYYPGFPGFTAWLN